VIPPVILREGEVIESLLIWPRILQRVQCPHPQVIIWDALEGPLEDVLREALEWAAQELKPCLASRVSVGKHGNPRPLGEGAYYIDGI
jgi:hypothetical protein